MNRKVKLTYWALGAIVMAAVVTTLILLNFAGPEKIIERNIHWSLEGNTEQFLREAGVLLSSPIMGGNRVKDLHNGEEIFPAMLEAIEMAERTVNLETFIYWSGTVGAAFAEALITRARHGVTVNIIIDSVGSEKLDDSLWKEMEDAGINIVRYHPLAWHNLSRLNNRTHRKLLIVDGRIGFIGGAGIADDWLGNGMQSDKWRDMHFAVEGPIVAQMQSVFNDNWIKSTGTVLNGPDYYPKLEEVGEIPAQAFSSSPSGGSESMHLMYLLAIAAAKSSIDLAAAYFIPDTLTEDALYRALERGVRLRILLPSNKTDSQFVRHASRAKWGGLLKRGGEIYLYEPAMLHSKLMIVDGFLVSVGSTNFDNRSFSLNDEASLNIYDNAFAERMRTVFEGDLAHSRQFHLEDWRERGWFGRVQEKVAFLVESQL